MKRDGVRKIIWESHFDEMEIIGTIHFSIAVPIKADPEFKAMVLAAGVTHSGGDRSIDYAYKRHKDEFIQRFDPNKTCSEGSLKECLVSIRDNAVNTSKKLEELDIPEGSKEGLVIAVNTLIRLRATFHASVQLALSGLGIEADAVTRQGLEQVAWCLRIMDIADYDVLQKIKPNVCITSMKDHIKGSGLIYGLLSDAAHIAPRTHDRFISIVDDEVKITIRDPDSCAMPTFFILLLLDSYNLAVTEVCDKLGIESQKDFNTTREIFNRCLDFSSSEFNTLLQQWRQI